MIIKTKFLGELEIDDNEIITFEYGLPGFLDLHHFVMLPVEGNPYLFYMQSVDEEKVCFIVSMPAAIIDDYDIDISDDAVAALEIEKPEDVRLYVIINIQGDITTMTANLKAPIILNINNKKGAQELLTDERFEIKHKIAREA